MVHSCVQSVVSFNYQLKSAKSSTTEAAAALAAMRRLNLSGYWHVAGDLKGGLSSLGGQIMALE
jgi:hypothetical protein